MRILIVCSNLRFGGAERVAATLANGFDSHKHKVIVITNLFEKIIFPLHNDIVLESLVNTNNNKLKKWGKAPFLLRQQIKKHQPDIIIGIMPTCSFIAKIAAIGLHIPVIATEHNSFERPLATPMSKSLKFSKFYLNKLYHYITVLTQADKKAIRGRLKNVFVMPNPLFLNPIKTIPLKDKIVLAAGRIDGWHVKGFDLLLQTWSKIIDNEKIIKDGWWLEISGAGKQDSFEYLKGLLPDGEWKPNDNVNDSHINTSAEKQNSQKSGVWKSEKYHIEFLGFQKNMEALYKKSEIFVLSSRYEGFGLVLIEAMSQGCAPVACDYKGRQKEIIGDPPKSSLNREDFQKTGIEICENGILCEPDNVEALAQAIERMIKDEEYRKMVQRNVVERSKFYDMEHTIDRWEKYLKEIITNN